MIDEIFHYRVKTNSYLAKCQVRINNNVAVVTELPDNTGMSITNAAEELAMQVCQYYEIPMAELIWIEYYPQRVGRNESFDRVKFQIKHSCFTEPTWEPISDWEAEKLIGCPLRRL
jgi:hypothetical protein